ncbi:DUF5320 domain-containing protein [Patescibacteria group bacterium]|nr:DUF5320 domain-containing protein [Patescibacteria group bacterium]
MPNLDGKGPESKGPLTGRKLGKCDGAIPCPRSRCGASRGFGRGAGRRIDNSSQK